MDLIILLLSFVAAALWGVYCGSKRVGHLTMFAGSLVIILAMLAALVVV